VQEKLRSLAGDALRTTERVSAKGRIERTERRYRLTLTVRDGATVKERTIESDSCVDLGGAAAVTLGLLLGRGPNSGEADRAAASAAAGGTSGDNSTAGRGSEATPSGDTNGRPPATGAAAVSKTTPSSTKEPTTKSSSDADAARAEDDGATSTRAWRVLLRAPLLTVDLFRLPRPSIGVGAGLGLRVAEWRVLATGRILNDQTVWSAQYPNQVPEVGTRVSRWTADLSLCRGWRSGSLEVSPCLTVGLDHLTVRGQGPANIARHSRRTMAALIGGSGTAHLYLAEWMAVFAGAGVAAATSSPTFTIEGLGEVGHAGPVQVSIGVGPEWIF
jgi:hypothetical protein